jgi:hypothetical protein
MGAQILDAGLGALAPREKQHDQDWHALAASQATIRRQNCLSADAVEYG